MSCSRPPLCEQLSQIAPFVSRLTIYPSTALTGPAFIRGRGNGYVGQRLGGFRAQALSGRRLPERLAQSAPFEQRHHAFVKPLQTVLEIEPGEQHTIDAELAQRLELIRDIGSAADDGIPTYGDNETCEARLLIAQVPGFCRYSCGPAVDTLAILVLDRKVVQKFFRRLTSVALHDGHLHPHADFAAEFLPRHRLVALDALFSNARGDKTEIGVLAREALTAARGTGVHDDRARLLERLRHRHRALELQELAFEVELFLRRPESLQHAHPFIEIVVARIMLRKRQAEHLELGSVPASNHIEPEAPARNVVDRGRLLGDNEGMDCGRVAGSEDSAICRCHRDACRPHKWIEHHSASMLYSRLRQPLPARQGEQRLETCAVRELRRAQRVFPRGSVCIGRDRMYGADRIGGESTELQFVLVQERVSSLAGCSHEVTPRTKRVCCCPASARSGRAADSTSCPRTRFGTISERCKVPVPHVFEGVDAYSGSREPAALALQENRRPSDQSGRGVLPGDSRVSNTHSGCTPALR